MFRCNRWRATMSISSCAKRWRAHRDADVEHRDACHGCDVGAAHADEQPDQRSALYQLPICPRCRRRSSRIIGGLRCVSCYNRQREFISGRNAKGTPPSIVLKPARIGLVINPGEAGEVVIDVAEVAVLDSVELAVAAMRVVDGAVVFTRPRGGAAIDLAELRRRHGTKRPPRKPMPRRRVMPRTGT
jgi:hypothetical protein